MANQLKFLTTSLIPEYCHDEFFEKFNFMHVECLKITISKCLGLGIIAGSALVKIPQILKLFQAKSAVGLSILSILLELFAVTISAAYSYANNFPFSSYGEALFLVLQTSLIAFMVMLYDGNAKSAYGFVFTYSSALLVLFSGYTPINALWFLQTLVLPISVSSKMVQAYSNFSNGHTGQLSVITAFLLFGGSLARIFTSIQETGDNLIILVFITSTFANFIIVSQIVYYWDATTKLVNKKSSKKMK